MVYVDKICNKCYYRSGHIHTHTSIRSAKFLFQNQNGYQSENLNLSKQLAHPSPNHSCYTNRVHNHSPRHKLKCTLLLHLTFQKVQGLSYVYHMNIGYLPVTIGLE